MQTDTLKRISLITGTIVLIPVLLSVFSKEMNWDLADFIIAAILIFTALSAYEYFARKGKASRYKMLIGGVILLVFLMIWAHLAVGLF